MTVSRIQDMSEWSNSIKRKALGKTERPPEWGGRAEIQYWVIGAWYNVSQWLSFFPFCSIYQQRPAGKHINPQKTKYSFILGN